MRIDLALLFTWREVARVKNSVNTNLLIMDEVFDSSLDGFGTDEFLKLSSLLFVMLIYLLFHISLTYMISLKVSLSLIKVIHRLSQELENQSSHKNP